MSIGPELRIIVAGGGTGGHLYPGIAVAREILARQPGATVSFAGTARGIESRIVPREGFALDLVRSAGLKGKSIAARVRGAVLLPLGLADAWRILGARRPHVVIGVGGYSSGPVVLAAALRRVPTMILEQNAVPGLTNRLLARVCSAAAVTFEEAAAYFGSKAVVSGNPVRPEFLTDGEAADRRRADDGGARILVFGGSQGAHAINVAMVAAAPRLAAAAPPIRVTHQTGERDLAMVRAGYRDAGLEAVVEPFLYDMGRRIADADLIVCRAGATTIAEIAAAGKAAILVPLPTATDDHQRRNAEALVKAGAAEMLAERDATGSVLSDRILALAADRRARARLGSAARGFARPDAARVIVDRVLALAREGGWRPGARGPEPGA
jgi:UDP-N-acetylglucosamine--N-acetylmuramyl-(pentapeptide) pyrophosphoryl-undecaprenol N-acetylglucosamine transferase